MAQTAALVEALKRVLKEKGLTYAQVAHHLDMSLPSVKRMFADQHFSLRRLDQICELAGVEITELAERLDRQRRIEQLTHAQEEELVADERLLLVAVCTLNHWSFDDILATYGFTPTELVRYLARLDRLRLLELQPGNRIKMLISHDFHWLSQGPIQRFFEAQVQGDFFRSRFHQPGELRLFAFGMLSSNTNTLMQQKMQRLLQDFRHYHEQDVSLPLDQRHGTALTVAMRPWELAVFAKYRRKPDDKTFP